MSKPGHDHITQKRLKEMLHYDPDTGVFTYLYSYRRIKKGDKAGIVNSATGYMRICLDGYRYLAHRLAWFYATGDWAETIDHINHDKTDNRLINLRDVPQVEQCRNKGLSSINTSGVSGVHWCRTTKRWIARIKVDYVRYRLGSYKRFKDAVTVRKAAEKEHGFHENHGS